MRRYHPWRKLIELRAENSGKKITDSLSTVEIDVEALDVASELEPLSAAGVSFFDAFGAVMVRTEFPKWRRHGQFWRYLRGIFGPSFRANRLQPLLNRFAVKREPAVDAALLKEEIRRYAADCGFAVCGFTKVDRRFIGEGADDKFPYDSAVVLGMEMDAALLDEMPSPTGRLVDFEAYIAAGRQVLRVAQHIRRLGYRCVGRPAFDAWVKYVPHAVNAGLAELGANGVALTPQFGPRQRWCMISVDADLVPDAPADFGLADFCQACQLCVHGCPGRAISEEKLWWRGVRKHKVNTVHCWPYFVKFDGCAICLKICPLNRFGYASCMAAFRRDGTILGKPPGVAHFLERRGKRRLGGARS
jgi:ferredoxin